MRNDLRLALRTIARERGYAAVTILTLALAIGANTAIFSIVSGALLNPLSYREPGRLVVVNEVVPEVSRVYPRLPVNGRHYLQWRDRSSSFDRLAILRALDMTLTKSGEPERVGAVRVSANLFPMLGAAPRLGRGFTAAEDEPGRDRVVVLADSLWNRRFHRDPRLLGQALVLDGNPYTVVGILAPDFRLPKSGGDGMVSFPENAEIFKPIALTGSDLEWMGSFNFTVIGRLKRGVTEPAAAAELNVMQAAIDKQAPEQMRLRASLTPLREEVVGPSRRGLLLLLAAVGAVLLTGCANLANLSLARAAARSRELAIRAALGAGRARLMLQILTESLTLSLAGGSAGIALAWAGLQALIAAAPAGIPRLDEIRLDGRALWFAFGLSTLSGVLFGLIPAWRASAADPQDALRGSSRSFTEGRRGMRLRELLVSVEVGLSALLLIAAGLLAGSFARLLQVDRGFETRRVVAADIEVPRKAYPAQKDRAEYYRRVLEKLQTLPGVASAALISHLPLRGENWVDAIQKEGDRRPLLEQPTANMRFISPGYFRVMGIETRRGRVFDENDGKRRVAVISESAAERVWPGRNPVGRRFRTDPGEAAIEVVGVVKDVRVSLSQPPALTVYLPYWDTSESHMTAVLRTGPERAAMPSLRAAVWSVNPDSVVDKIRSMDEVVAGSVAGRRFQLLLIAAFAGSALLLAAIGIYGVVAWSVARRGNEIGIRMALGARASDVRRMVVREGLRPVALGLAVGAAAALALGRLLASLLFGVAPRDPLTFALAAAVLAAVGALACLAPARRAAARQPLEALRYE